MDYIDDYLSNFIKALKKLNRSEIEKTIQILVNLKKSKGRLFLLGVGGAAANSSHAVNDFRKTAHIEAYTPLDNVSELTARVNDDGWETIFSSWLKISKLSSQDCVMVLSVGGGDLKNNVSPNIVSALKYAKGVKAKIIGIVSRDGGYTKKVADCCIMVPVVRQDLITPFAEIFHALIWHLLVFSPKLRSIKPY